MKWQMHKAKDGTGGAFRIKIRRIISIFFGLLWRRGRFKLAAKLLVFVVGIF
jgi:hypothetical protein